MMLVKVGAYATAVVAIGGGLAAYFGQDTLPRPALINELRAVEQIASNAEVQALTNAKRGDEKALFEINERIRTWQHQNPGQPIPSDWYDQRHRLEEDIDSYRRNLDDALKRVKQ